MTNSDDKRNSPGDDEFLQRAAGLFDESVQRLDANTRSRLNQGRQQALAATDSRAVLWNAWLPAGAAAAAAIVVIVMWNGREQPEAFIGPDLTSPTIATDLEILMDENDLEMLEELEFYSWIDLDEELDNADLNEHVG